MLSRVPAVVVVLSRIEMRLAVMVARMAVLPSSWRTAVAADRRSLAVAPRRRWSSRRKFGRRHWTALTARFAGGQFGLDAPATDQSVAGREESVVRTGLRNFDSGRLVRESAHLLAVQRSDRITGIPRILEHHEGKA